MNTDTATNAAAIDPNDWEARVDAKMARMDVENDARLERIRAIDPRVADICESAADRLGRLTMVDAFTTAVEEVLSIHNLKTAHDLRARRLTELHALCVFDPYADEDTDEGEYTPPEFLVQDQCDAAARLLGLSLADMVGTGGTVYLDLSWDVSIAAGQLGAAAAMYGVPEAALALVPEDRRIDFEILIDEAAMEVAYPLLEDVRRNLLYDIASEMARVPDGRRTPLRVSPAVIEMLAAANSQFGTWPLAGACPVGTTCH